MTEENEAGLKFRIHEPEGEVKRVVLLVHGRAGNFDSKWVFARAFKQPGTLIIAPQAPIRDEPMENITNGFSWWPVTNTNTERSKGSTEEDLQEGTKYLLNFLDGIYVIFPELKGLPVYASGFSMGAGLVSAVSLERPELFSGVSMLAGFMPAFVYEKSFDTDLKRPEYFIFHGSEDQIIPIEKAKRAKEFLNKLRLPVEFHQDEVRHKVSSNGIKALKNWFEGLIEKET